MSELKDAGILMRMMNSAMQQMDVDIESIYRKCGVTEAHLENTQIRTPHEANLIFWNAAETVTQDANVGLHFGEKMPVFKGQVLEYLFLSSPSFGEGLKRALDYQRLLSDAASARLEIDGDQACLIADTSSDVIKNLRHFNECVAVGLIQFFKYVTEGEFSPSKLTFHFSQPADISEHQRVFGCPVEFNNAHNRIYFDAELLKRSSLHAESELLELHEQLAGKHVAKLERQDLISRVNKIIGELLETGEVSLDVVAERMSLKSRSLRSKLTEAGTNFNQLFSDYRCHLAKRLLVRTEESVDEIVYLTGFSEPSTFYRAFKRWTGMTPVEYRKSKSGMRF
ncbi:AraC family transcriptional regulator [Litoribacillus peritrichatus]|uniref:AraC family transcriptional regulator n=1 Tax=Litoribacillus peritrichatus TaxID=718191 RepID=A0ABP7MEK8_9GAMM